MPPAKGAVSIDSEIKGFGLRVYAPTRRHLEGSKAFFMNYRAFGVERRLTIGEYPTWGALAARVKAKALRKEIDSGGDPARERREAAKPRQSKTWPSVIAASICRARRRPRARPTGQ